MDTIPHLLRGLLLCAGSLPLPFLASLVWLCSGAGAHRQGRFPLGAIRFGGGMSLSDPTLAIASAATAACQWGLWSQPPMLPFAWASAALIAILALPPLCIQLICLDWGGSRAGAADRWRARSAPEELALDRCALICIHWSCQDGVVSVADGYCVAPADGLAAKIAAMGAGAEITSSSFDPLNKPRADGSMDLSWNEPVDGVRWLCSRSHGEADLNLKLPKRHPKDEASHLDWTLRLLRAYGLEPIGRPMLPSMRGEDYEQFYEGPDIPTGATLRGEAFLIARSIQGAREIDHSLPPKEQAPSAAPTRL